MFFSATHCLSRLDSSSAFRLIFKKPERMRKISVAIVICLREAGSVLAKGLFGYINYNSQMEIDRMHENTQMQQKR